MNIFIFFLLLGFSGVLFIYETYRRYLGIKLGRPDNRSKNSPKRLKYFFTQVVLHTKIRKYPFFGMLHGFIMWGFPVLLLSSFSMAMEGLFKLPIPFLSNNFGYLFIRDFFILLTSIGVMGSALRRIVKKPQWMHNSPMSFTILALILLILSSELLFYAAQASFRFRGQSIQSGFPSGLGGAWLVLLTTRLFLSLNNNLAVAWMGFFWWAHFLAIFAFLLVIPRSKHIHLVFAPFNTYWHTLEPKGALPAVQLAGDKGITYGAGQPEDFTWKQLLDAFSCVKCGRCHGSCPAFQSGELLKLKKLNGRLRTYLEEKIKFKQVVKRRVPLKYPAKKIRYRATDKASNSGGSSKLVAGVLEEKSLWSCTTCGACEEACPVSCEHMAKIIDLRRHLVSNEVSITPEMKEVFNGIENYGNPMGIKRDRNSISLCAQELRIPTFTEKPDARYLYFMGCAPSFDESARNSAVAFMKILKRAGAEFAILGKEDWCCGETARRLGNEYLFQETAKRNIASWSRYGFKKILTTCPHCFNTLQNEYPQFGGNYQVIPHSVFLAEILLSEKVKPDKRLKMTVAYHDSCYLGRFNNFYTEARAVLKAIPGVGILELPRAREDSFCCGAGGGQYWLKAKSENPISRNRAKEVVDSGAEILATACPYCHSVLQKGIEGEGSKDIRVIDIVEILESSL